MCLCLPSHGPSLSARSLLPLPHQEHPVIHQLADHILPMLHCVIYVLSHYFSRFLGEKQGHAAWRHHSAGAFLKKQIHQADLPSRCGNGNAGGRRSLFMRRGVPGRGGRFADSYCSDALWGVSDLLVRVSHHEVLMQCHGCIHTHTPSSLHLVHQIFFFFAVIAPL